MKTSVDIFIAYSHDDKPQKDELKKFLRPLLNAGQIKVWDDHDIEAGRDWEAEIKKKLYGADIILLLVSHNSLASDYFYGKEVKSSLQRHERGEAVVVPVILGPCLWEETPISKLEALPAKARPVSQWPTQGEAFADVARNIAEITRRLLAQHRQLKDIEEQRRQYASAVKAADHLYEQQRWSEARKAFIDALALWQSPFEPAATTLQGRIAECDQSLKRESDYARHIDNTRHHLQRQAWPKAAAEAALALRLKPGDEVALQLQQQAANTPVRENTPFAPTRMYVLLAVLAVVVVAVAIWVANRGNDKTSTAVKTQNIASPAPDGFVKIEGGTFLMGDIMGDKESDNETLHPVTVNTFYLSPYEVTFEEYDHYCKATGKEKLGDNGWGRGKRPVINVTWYDAVEYCNWRSQQAKLKPVYTINGENVSADWSANGYRLPTEAEWEYAARALNGKGGGKVRFSNGKDIADPKELNFNGTKDYKKTYSVVGEYRSKTTLAGNFPANSLGVYDMSGNVSEWCWDWYDTYPTNSQTDPKGAGSGSYRVIRGGSWYFYPDYARCAYRSYSTPGYSDYYLGFRLARAAR